ncbi:hypothetical protein EYC58_04820 [Candidatus Saccharibacteria bacterium]|nr:MAG: hypothetical protein EYC58_04820 [Candidatus Saccharibacteria bacterium]
MPIARAFSGSHEGAMPFAAVTLEPPRPQTKGIEIGTSPTTRRGNYLDIYKGIADGTFPAGGEIISTGGRGEGKTTAVKNLTIGHLAYQAISPLGEIEEMRAFIDNRKQQGQDVGEGVVGEWGGVVEELGCDILDVTKLQLELLDPKNMPPADQLKWMVSVARLANRKNLKPDQRLVIAIALEQLQRTTGNEYGFRTLEAMLRRLNAEDIHEFHARLDAALVERFTDETEDSVTRKAMNELLNLEYVADCQPLIKAARQVSRLYQLVLKGMFGSMYAGRTTITEHLRKSAVMFDFTFMEPEEYEFFEVLRFQAMTSALKAGDTSLVPHLMVREEIQEAITNPVLLESWALWSATQRSRHQLTLSTTQYLTNLFAGAARLETRGHVTAILNGINCLVLFKQPIDEEVYNFLQGRGLSDQYIRSIPKLPLGVAIIKFDGHEGFYNQFHVPPAMRHLIKSRGTARRMAYGRKPVTQDPRILSLS